MARWQSSQVCHAFQSFPRIQSLDSALQLVTRNSMSDCLKRFDALWTSPCSPCYRDCNQNCLAGLAAWVAAPASQCLGTASCTGKLACFRRFPALSRLSHPLLNHGWLGTVAIRLPELFSGERVSWLHLRYAGAAESGLHHQSVPTGLLRTC